MEAVAAGGDLAILHPPCTALGLCGNRHYGNGCEKNNLRLDALDWTEGLWNLAKKRFNHVALENPKSIIGRRIGPHTTVHPWQYGHPEQKETWLWLHNLPELKPTKIVYEEMMKLPRKERERVFFASPSATRGHDRAITFQGIAEAMADQWGNLNGYVDPKPMELDLIFT